MKLAGTALPAFSAKGLPKGKSAGYARMVASVRGSLPRAGAGAGAFAAVGVGKTIVTPARHVILSIANKNSCLTGAAMDSITGKYCSQH